MTDAVSPQAARDQAAEYWGFAAGRRYDIGNGDTLELPHPHFFDDDQQRAYDQLKLDSESWDHEETEARSPLTGDVVTHPKTGEPIMDRILLVPHRKNGQLVESFSVQLCKAIWGAANYKKFRTAGGNANQITVELKRMEREFQERLEADTKSEGSD